MSAEKAEAYANVVHAWARALKEVFLAFCACIVAITLLLAWHNGK